MFELPSYALQLDLAILDDDSQVFVLGEAKRATPALAGLRDGMLRRFAAASPGPETKKRGDEQRQLGWRVWTVQPQLTWLIGPGHREAFKTEVDPLRLTPLAGLPRAVDVGLSHRPPARMKPPRLT